MPKYLFVTHDDGDTRKITGVTVRDDSFIVDTKLYEETQSIDLFNTVSELIKSTEIRFNSNHIGELKIEDLNQDKIDPLIILKRSFIQRGRLLINQRIDSVSLFGFAQFIILNNYMSNAGFFITNENREQKYLEIINTNNQELIAALEQYLESLDTVSKDLYWYNHYNEFVNSVEFAQDEEEVHKAFESFNSLFN